MLKGIAASNGIVIGKAYVVKETKPELPQHDITPEQREAELERLDRARAVTRQQLEAIRADLAAKAGESEAAIFDAHLMLLDDPMLGEAVVAKINEGRNAEMAVHQAGETFAGMFDAMDDEYMRGRAADVRDICTRWVNNLLGVETGSLGNMTEPAVVFAHDLAPSDTAQMDKTKVLAFVTEIGGRTSHSAIMARSLEIPAVVGVGDLSTVANGDTVIVDGNAGEVIVNPDPAVLAEYQERRRTLEERKEKLRALKDLPAQTPDGKTFVLAANIGTPDDVDSALAYGAEGVGLYRTEFLYMDRADMPTEQEQYQAYRKVLEAFGRLPVIIRTLDIGGDKELPYLKLDRELNPFLGNRAIRLCLSNPGLFKTQLRAILRAGVSGNPWIMLPMVATLDEVRRTKALLREVEAELEAEGIPFTRDYKLGIMIEIPSAAVQADHFAREVDFFSIGTNDLIQYTLAVDRMNEKVSYLYDPFNPAVLRLIEQVIQAGHRHGIFVGMCGEMAGEPLATPLLMAMGLDEFSMSASSIPQVKAVIRSLDIARCRELWQQAQQFTDGSQIRQLMERELKDIL
ncbi:MAG TPA: phosphoenolpyruvate--protein phosphotransferase [Bacillota bacterium]|nr:phosphoenolpyruvate--protein phosphotransferase [Bacillota bacterium]HQE02467.1 phosphoenolpyruvate--protein phosphotransferase [Bacillota bacterium]